MLTAFQKGKVIEAINKMVIDESELDSYKRTINPQDYNRFAEPDDEDWDEDEAYRAMGEQLIDYIEHDGLNEWVDLPEELKEDVIVFIQKECEC